VRRKTKKALAKVSRATGVAVAAIVTEVHGQPAARRREMTARAHLIATDLILRIRIGAAREQRDPGHDKRESRAGEEQEDDATGEQEHTEREGHGRVAPRLRLHTTVVVAKPLTGRVVLEVFPLLLDLCESRRHALIVQCTRRARSKAERGGDLLDGRHLVRRELAVGGGRIDEELHDLAALVLG